MKRKYYTGITWAMVVLLCSVMGLGQIHAQGADREKHTVGIRLKPGEAILVYGDNGGSPDPNAIYTLTNDFYIVEVNPKTPKSLNGVDYRKVHLPGPLPDNTKLAEFTSARAASSGLTPTDWGKDFWIEAALLDDKDEKTSLFIPEVRYSKFSIGVLSVPFKYRFSYEKNDTAQQLGAESSIGLSLAFDFYHSNGFDERFSFVFGAGLTSINPNTVFDDSVSSKSKNIPGASICFGVLGFIQKAQVGIIYGYDFADTDWTFHKKPWVAISIGYAFFNPKPDDKGNSK